MAIKGFWTYRCSNDFLFIVEDGRDEVIARFGKFLERAMGSERWARRRIWNPPQEKYIDLDLCWEQLISIEVQTRKTLKLIAKGKKAQLHVKFYFHPDYIERYLWPFFNSVEYEASFKTTASWSSVDKPGSPAEVFAKGTGFDEVVVKDPFFEGLNALSLSGCALPKDKNIKIVARSYQDALLNGRPQLDKIAKRNSKPQWF